MDGKITEFEIQVGTGVKIEILEIATGEAAIVGRRPVALCEARERKRKPCSCPESRQNGTVQVHGLFLVGLGKDPKEVEERVEPSILGAGSSCPVIECFRLTYPTVCGVAENQHGTPKPGAPGILFRNVI